MKQINYDGVANIYARNRPANSFVIDELLKDCRLDYTSKVLEIGCGTGSHIQMLVKAVGCHGWGVDPSQEMLNQSPKSERVRFLIGTAEKLPFEDNYFDFLFSVDVIHYLKSTFIYFHEALRVLKPGGTICTVTDSERNIRYRKPLSQYWPSTAVIDLKRYPPISLLKEQMEDTGFIDIDENNIQSTLSNLRYHSLSRKGFFMLAFDFTR